MIRKVTYLIPFLLSLEDDDYDDVNDHYESTMKRIIVALDKASLCPDLSMSSKVFFYYNKIPTTSEIGMDCRVSDPEERSLVKINQGNREMLTMTTGCILKSNNSRLSISCVETYDFILLSVNMTGYTSSDLETWNCSDGKSSDTVTFQDFIQNTYLRESSIATFKCIANEDCYLSLYWNLLPDYVLRRNDGTDFLRLKFGNIQINDAYRGRITFTENYTYPILNFTFLEMKFSDAGIYYLMHRGIICLAAVIIQVQDYPTLPLISSQNLNLNTDQGLFELICSSESRIQPVFSRNQRFYRWKVNGVNPTDLLTCFMSRGPVFVLCRESCRLEANTSISVTCTVEVDGLMSNESEPFIIRLDTQLVPVEHQVNTTPGSASVEYKDHTGDHSTGHSIVILIGACVGCLLAGSVLSVFGTLLFIRRSVLFKKGQNGRGNSGDRNEPFHINSVVDCRSIITETETTRQYEVLDQTRMEYPKSQYSQLSKGSGHMNEPEMYENF